MASNGMDNINSGEEIDISELPWKQRLQYRLKKMLKSLRLFIYNKEHQTILGTTSDSWFKIAVYYFFFYVCLALFYCGMVAIFAAIISRESPRYSYRNSELNDGGNCYIGMGFRPMQEIDDTSITVYNDTKSFNDSMSSLDNYRRYLLTQTDLSYVDECSPTQPASSLKAGRSCRFSWTDVVPNELHPCAPTKFYGWSTGQPCILIKLNQIYGWVPESGSVIDKLTNWTQQPVSPVDAAGDNIYITCNGADAADVDTMGPIIYYSILHPTGNPAYGGLPHYFFPYLNSREHVQPFVLVQFLNLTYDRVINVECRAWASNVVQSADGTQRRGMVTFNIFRSKRARPAKS